MKKEKFLWISPPNKYQMGFMFPYGLGVLDVSARKGGYESGILYLDESEETWKEELDKEIDNYTTFGITIFDNSLYYAKLIYDYLKSKGKHVIIGGNRVAEEYEMLKKGFEEKDIIKGDGRGYFNFTREYLPMNGVNILNLKDYKRNYVMRIWGCPFKCAFCSNDGKYTSLRKDDDKIIKYAEELILEHNYDSIMFFDGTFTTFGYKDFLRKWLKSKVLKEIKIISTARFDTIDKEGMELIEKTFKSVLFGLDGFSERQLKIVGKGFTLKDIYKGIDLLTKYDKIAYTFTFILGYPDETKKEYKEAKKMFDYIFSSIKYPKIEGNGLKPYTNSKIYKIYTPENYNPFTKETKQFYYMVNEKACNELIDYANDNSLLGIEVY